MDRRLASAALVGVFLLSGCHEDTSPPPPAPTHAISGTVTRAWGGALARVTLTLGGTATGTAVTNDAGAYRFDGLADGSYTVTPALAGYVFAPAAPSVPVSGVDATRNFTADGAYSISGSVSGSAQGGVTISLSGGGVVKPDAVTADGTGAYEFTGIPNGTYTLTPSLPGHVFSPAAASVVVAGASETQVFAASALRRITGTVRDDLGAPLAGMTVRLSGASAAIATTDAAGAFTFGGLAQGATYTVTAATFGYASTPPDREYTLAGDVTDADFTASLARTELITYAGTVSYAGAKAGPVYVTVGSRFAEGNPSGGTGLLAQAPPWNDRAFEVRNAPAGTEITIRAWIDTLGTGRFNAGADPSVTWTGSVSPTSGTADLGALVLTDPSSPPTVGSHVSIDGIIPGDGTAVVVVGVPRDPDGNPIADRYVVSWNDGATVDPLNRLGSIDVDPAGTNFVIVRGLTNGTPYWFRADAWLGGAPIASETVITGPTTVAPQIGGASASGTVTHPAVTAPSALYVVAQSAKGAPGADGIFFARATPTGTATSYALDVPPGTYQVFAFVDVGDDGVVAAGEPSAFPAGEATPTTTFVAGSNVGPTVALPAGGAAASVRTSVREVGQWRSSALAFGISSGAKVPLAATASGPGLRGEVDLAISPDGAPAVRLGSYFQTGPVLPFVGDVYTLAVTYADGTTESFERAVTGLFGRPPLAASPADGATGVSVVPTFTWTAPTGDALSYGYLLGLKPSGGDGVWQLFLPGSRTSVVYDEDGTATAPQLSAYTEYEWAMVATDSQGNDALSLAYFTTGAGPPLPLIDALDGAALDGDPADAAARP